MTKEVTSERGKDIPKKDKEKKKKKGNKNLTLHCVDVVEWCLVLFVN